MSDFGFKADIAETVKSLLGDTLEQGKASSAAIGRDGRVFAEALPSLGWFAYNGTINGAVTTGSNILRWPFPQGGVIRRVSFDARTAPTGGQFEFTISGGETSDSFSLQPGVTTGASGSHIVMMQGAWARISITSSGGAQDIAITVHYSPGGV